MERADRAGGHRGRGPAGRAARYGAGGSGLQRHHASLAAVGLAEAFDAVVSIARIGVAKPDPRVFTTAAGRVGTEPRRCLFVDDSLGNVTAARAVGMAGLHYRNIGQLREAVAPLLG
ncbi:HAD-IA family hydrolase [Streptomyces rimosus]|nr:HAD-IA family hydrolase [Streptomyces rimosus]